MFSIYLSHLEPGCRSALKKFLKLLFARMDKAETFQFFEGNVGLELTLSPEEVASIEMDVTMEMTRYRGEQQLQSYTQAAQRVAQFYASPPEIQERIAPLYTQMLKALQINSADEIIAPLAPSPMDPAAAASQPAQPVSQGSLPQPAPQPLL